MGGLGFAAPYVLLALAALPALYFLLRVTPPPAARLHFGGEVFLSLVTADRRTPAHTPPLILLLRLLTVAALIIGLASPVQNPPRDTTSDAPMLVILDDSWVAAPGWADRQGALRPILLDPGASRRPARLLTTAGTPTLSPLMTLGEVAAAVEGLTPRAASANRAAALALLGADASLSPFDVHFISDGTVGRTKADRDFLRALRDAATLSVYRTPARAVAGITSVDATSDVLRVNVQRIGAVPTPIMLTAIGQGGRDLAEVMVDLSGAADTVTANIELPLSLRNELERLTLSGAPHAGSVFLLDAGTRRARIGLVTAGSQSLLDSGFYLARALEGIGELAVGPLSSHLNAETGLIVLDDVGALRPSDAEPVIAWVDKGGILLRFAGPNTAVADSQIGTDPTFPLPLRSTERALGGAMTWTEPQKIERFSPDSPLGDLPLTEDIIIRRQVLTRSQPDANVEVWAELTDGTPLVSARELGRGRLILVHVSASPSWTDLPVSGLLPQMLTRIARQAAGAPPLARAERLAPLRLLAGDGRLVDPPADALSLAEGIDVSPGLYGDPQSSVAVNTWTDGRPTLDPLEPALLPQGTRIIGLDGPTTRSFAAPFLLLALLLFAVDALIMFRQQIAAGAVIGLGIIIGALAPTDAMASQPAILRPDLDPALIAAASRVEFGVLPSGDATLDRLAFTGLTIIAEEAGRRSALEGARVARVDAERDELAVYPLIYWPVTPATPMPSDSALAQLERYMDSGGLLIIDTGDGERQLNGVDTPAMARLREILARMTVPPLEPLPADSILLKSFYRLDQLDGRNDGGTIWVEAAIALEGSTDGVPSLVISGRDWAGAWARDESGRPMRPMSGQAEGRREYTIRTGINLAMVALTGNYKEDQVHVQALLDRLEATP